MWYLGWLRKSCTVSILPSCFLSTLRTLQHHCATGGLKISVGCIVCKSGSTLINNRKTFVYRIGIYVIQFLSPERYEASEVLPGLSDDDCVADHHWQLLLDGGLDGHRRDVLAARGDDDLLLPAVDEVEAVLVLRRKVARAEVAVLSERLLRPLLVSEIIIIITVLIALTMHMLLTCGIP